MVLLFYNTFYLFVFSFSFIFFSLLFINVSMVVTLSRNLGKDLAHLFAKPPQGRIWSMCTMCMHTLKNITVKKYLPCIFENIFLIILSSFVFFAFNAFSIFHLFRSARSILGYHTY